MKFKRKITIPLALLILSVVVSYCLPRCHSAIPFYDRYIFYPFQSLRGCLSGVIPFSIGDVLYVLGGAWLLVTVGMWVYFLVQFSRCKERLAASVLSAVNTVLFVYLFFIFGWGANYYKPPLREYWGLNASDSSEINQSLEYKKRKATAALIAFDSFLVSNLNIYAPHYHHLAFKEINERAKTFYKTCTDSRVKQYGLDVKPTFFGYFMDRLAVEGYYNPFTGEGQVVSTLPAYTLPFTVCHEMAHQAGIAAEGDANLMAYALCTATDDSTFRYSGYLNIWIYANNRLFRRDSVLAKQFEAQLNKLTTAHIDTLEQISRKYNNEAAHYSTELYDNYLKMQDQKEGIRSYGNVSSSAWLLEQHRMKGLINIP